MRSFRNRPSAALLAGGLFLVSLTELSSSLFAQTAEPLAPAPEAVNPGGPQATGEGPAQAESPPATSSAILQGLDKITARVSEFEAPIDETVYFGSFEIVVRVCKKTPPEEPPESTAYLEITDVRPDEPATSIFKGWMFASSPALSAVEHPVYDVWVTGCRVTQAAVSPAPDSGAAPDDSAPAENATAQ